MFGNFFDIERFIHSIKTALACIIGIIVVKLTHFTPGQTGQWIVITIVIVMCAQINVGSLVQKSYLRLAGTLIGCVIAIIAIVFFGTNETVTIITIAIAGFLFSYIATSQENLVNLGTLGAATTIIIMTTYHPTVGYATLRFFEISIGILIAALVSQFILPIHARTHLLRSQAQTLNLLRTFYLACMKTAIGVDYLELEESVVKTISKQRQLSKEAAREPLGIFFDRNHFIQTLQCEKQMLRAIVFMRDALAQLKDKSNQTVLLTVLGYLNDTIPKAFDALISVMEKENSTNIRFDIPNIEPFITMQDAENKQKNEMFYMNGFLFSAEILINSLIKLATLFHLPVNVAPLERGK